MELAAASSILRTGEVLLLFGGFMSLLIFTIARPAEKYGQVPPPGTGPWFAYRWNMQTRWLWVAIAVVGLVLTIVGLL